MVSKHFNKYNYETELIDVARLKYNSNGCVACYNCQKSTAYECAIKDEATPILKRLPEAEILIFSTPIYFMGPNAQLKLFMDRMFSLNKINDLTGEHKTCLNDIKYGLISTAGGDYESGLNTTEAIFSLMSKFMKAKFESLLVGEIHKYDNLTDNKEINARVEHFVTNLVKN